MGVKFDRGYLMVFILKFVKLMKGTERIKSTPSYISSVTFHTIGCTELDFNQKSRVLLEILKLDLKF